MSAPTEIVPGAGATGSTDGRGGATGIPSSHPDESTSAPGPEDRGSQDYLGRIRAGGDFAEREVRNHQSRADKAEAEIRRLSESGGSLGDALKPLIDRGLTPEMIAATVNAYMQLRSHPYTQETVLGLENTGFVVEPKRQGKSDSDDDEFLTDEQREIRELRQRIESMQQDHAGLAQSTGSAAMQRHLERFSTENFLTTEEFGKLKNQLLAQVDQWKSNEQGLRLLRDMQRPDAYDTLEAIAWRYLPKEIRFELGDRKRLHDKKRIERHRTDVPTDASTTGKELPAEVHGARNALAWAKANPDKI